MNISFRTQFAATWTNRYEHNYGDGRRELNKLAKQLEELPNTDNVSFEIKTTPTDKEYKGCSHQHYQYDLKAKSPKGKSQGTIGTYWKVEDGIDGYKFQYRKEAEHYLPKIIEGLAD